jgi:hypothetical protein
MIEGVKFKICFLFAPALKEFVVVVAFYSFPSLAGSPRSADGAPGITLQRGVPDRGCTLGLAGMLANLMLMAGFWSSLCTTLARIPRMFLEDSDL